MQVAGELNRTYRSLTQSVASILKNEGVRGFYQGVTPALFAASGSWGGYFLCYEASKERKLKALPAGSKLGTADHVCAVYMYCNDLITVKHIALQLTSGVEAGAVLVFIFNPVWVVKTRLALQGVDLQQKRKYTGPIGL